MMHNLFLFIFRQVNRQRLQSYLQLQMATQTELRLFMAKSKRSIFLKELMSSSLNLLAFYWFMSECSRVMLWPETDF